MEKLDLELSSEFLVMAATLLQIKSKMLLPAEDDEEEEDPRTELVRRLVEYKRIKETIDFFREHENSDAALFFKLPDVIERPPAAIDYSALTTENLLQAYKMSFAKLERKLIEGPYIHHMTEVKGGFEDVIREFCKYVDGLEYDTF